MGTIIEESELFNFAKKLQILYVEDEEETRAITAEIFKNIFGTVIEAKNGIDGIEKFDDSIDLIITDINMPYMNGIFMLRTIKTRTPSVSSMIISAHSEISHFTDTIDIGIDGYLIKPIKTQILKTTIKRVVEKIFLKKELENYKKELEKKVKQQIDELNLKDEILMRQSRLAIMGELIDIIAHQWKQPLNVISARTQFLEFKTTDGKNISIKDVDECSIDVAYQVKHLVDTIDDFRRFLRPKLGIES
ncbi:MAG: response regulator, partial [Campylobacterales bacterium]|nr:response regulator [Campylobacterales bacterium]